MRCFFTFCSFLLTCISCQAFFGKYPIQNFTTKDYKAGIQNIDFAQNRDMNIFVANNLGILNYNGSQWELHNSGTGKKQRSLAFDPKLNRLYVGSQGEFGYFERDWNYVSLSDLLTQSDKDFDEVWDVFILKKEVYFCTFQGIYQFDGQHVSKIKNDIGFGRSFFVNGRVFCQNRKGKLFEIRDLKLLELQSQEFTNRVVAGIVPDGDALLIIYNSGEIEMTSQLEGILPYRNLVEVLKDTYVNHVLQLSDTRIVISTQTAGLFIYDLKSKTYEHISKEDGLESNACLRSFQDYSGNLWVGKQNGISLIDIDSPMRLVNQEIGIQGSGYQAFVADEGSYFSTSNGIYYQKKGSKNCIFIPGTEGPAYEIKEIAGRLYAGHHTGLLLLKGERAQRISRSDGLWKIQQLNSDPNYAIAGTYSGLYLYKVDRSEGLIDIGKISGFDESSRFFEEDEKGRIWVGQYYKGLYLLTLSEDFRSVIVEEAGEQFGLSDQEQIVLSKVANEIYIATNIGLFQYDEGNEKFVKAIKYSEEIGEQEVYLFREDKEKNIHIVAKNLVGFFKKISASNYQFVPSSLYQVRYFLNNDLLNISLDTEEGIYFSANEGFIQYYPDLEFRIGSESPLIIRKLMSAPQGEALYEHLPFEAHIDDLAEINVGKGSKLLQIEIEYFQFDNSNNKQFQYQLIGFDEEFTEKTSATTKEYSNLREGNYRFIVRTDTDAGEVIQNQILKIGVAPPIYRSLVAKILYFLLALGALLAVARIQKLRYELKAAKIEKKKQLEIDEKQEKLEKVEAQSEKDLSRLREEQMEANLRHVNNLLAASTMNLVVKNDFISTIRSQLTDLKKKSENSNLRQTVDRLIKEIDSTLRIQEDWEQFEYHFDQLHGDFVQRLQNTFNDLTPNEQKLCVFLRLNLNTKEIANLLGISTRGVEVARYRLRKKLNLDKGANLSKFILEF